MRKIILALITAAAVVLPATAAHATGNHDPHFPDPCPGVHVQVYNDAAGNNFPEVGGHFVCGPVKGDTGPAGPTGPQGPPGDSITGPQGEKGDDGAPGLAGEDGRDGEDAVCLNGVIVPASEGGSSVTGDESSDASEPDSGQDAAACLRGETGRPGADGLNGVDGRDGVAVNGLNGKDGANGLNGTNAASGDPATQPAQDVPHGDALAHTGSNTPILILGALCLLIMGAGFRFAASRR